MYWDEIDRTVIEQWMQELRRKNEFEVNSVNSTLAYLKAIFQYAVDERTELRYHIDYNPAKPVAKMKGGKVRGFVLTRERAMENYQWFKQNIPMFAPFYLTLVETGRRPVEVSQYTWEMIQDIEVDGRVVHVFTVSPELAKTNKPSILPIPESVWNAIREQAWRTGLIFRNTANHRWYSWQNPIERLREAFPGIEVGWLRDTRRGFATYKVQTCKMDRGAVKSVTGHKTDAMFDRYCITDIRSQLAVTNPELYQKQEGSGTKLAQFGSLR
jgi:integrase